ncbi:MAG: hypothetical protein SF051_14470 [Elusimicrobiota bacterium]|nr:hypothetical protein [Elusimicrobiota bacterium]
MGFSSLRSRWAGLAGHHKVAVLMAAAAMGVAAATPWLFDDGAIEQPALSTARGGRPRARPATSGGQHAAPKPADPGAAPATPPSSPLPVPAELGELFDGAPKQAVAAEGGGETANTAGAPSADAGVSEGGVGMGGKVGLKPADFGSVKGFVAEPRR